MILKKLELFKLRWQHFQFNFPNVDVKSVYANCGWPGQVYHFAFCSALCSFQLDNSNGEYLVKCQHCFNSWFGVQKQFGFSQSVQGIVAQKLVRAVHMLFSFSIATNANCRVCAMLKGQSLLHIATINIFHSMSALFDGATLPK